jgi:translation initiation factor 5A
MDVPHVNRTEYQLVSALSRSLSCRATANSPQIDIDDNFLSLMTTEGATKDDVKVPEGEVGEKIKADFDDGKEIYVSITKAMSEEACLSYRTA